MTNAKTTETAFERIYSGTATPEYNAADDVAEYESLAAVTDPCCFDCGATEDLTEVGNDVFCATCLS